MSKRLNKRQQRELEELEQLKAVQQQTAASSEDEFEEEEVAETMTEKLEREEEAGTDKPVNAFAALGAGEDSTEELDDDDEEEEEAATIVKKSKKKKPKKKKKKSTAATPAHDPEEEDHIPGPSSSTPSKTASTKKGSAAAADNEMDEVDRALAELNMKYGKESGLPATGKSGVAGPSSSSSTLGFRQMLAVDPKNLDADAELKRFFGSKVISSTASSSKSHRPTASSKLRYTISKSKPTYPPATSLAGLGMRELTDEEVEDAHDARMSTWRDPAEKWFTFEHAGVWRETTRQFLGAVGSHDPNQLMALLQVYPWHVDTLLQMSEVYRLQSDIGAASDYAERALYALDRCLIPAFNVSSGACRLNFDRVENRPMFLALHRIISYLGRRGCWVTAFNFAKLLFSLDPMGDPHGAAFWLDFLAIKSGNYAWIISMFEEHSEQFPVAVFQGYPGMAFAYALACRAREDAQKDKDRTRSNDALREAILAFPQAVIPLADKIGAEVPASARTHPLMQVQAGYSDDPTCAIHLLSHIYASRSEALWKEAPLVSWLSSSVTTSIPDLDRPDAQTSREDVLRLIHTPREPQDPQLSVPIFMCRHILCSESTSFVGFIPPIIHKRPFHMFDPLPPSTATTAYNNDYFSGVKPSRRRAGLLQRGAGAEQDEGNMNMMMGEFMNNVFAQRDANPTGWREALMQGWRGMMGQPIMGREMPREEREEAVQGMIRLAEEMVERRDRGEDMPMPGGFPGM